MSDQFRIVVVEDDPDVALYTKTVLEKRANCLVVTVDNAFDAVTVVRDTKPDVVFTDIEMPGMTGLQLIESIKVDFPDIPIVVTTAHASSEYADAALTAHADAFLVKPVSSAELVAVTRRLAEAARARTAAGAPRDSVLAIGFSAEDIAVGLGGILSLHKSAGDRITFLVLGGAGQPVAFQTKAAASADLLGARLIIESIDAIDSRRGGATVHAIERAIAEVEPTTVYTHSVNDTGAGHVDIYDATVVAAITVPTVASYQNSTSTIDFHPTTFVAIDDVIGAKLELLELFSGSELIQHLQPDTVLSTARYWGRYVDSSIAEPLETIREPKADPTA